MTSQFAHWSSSPDQSTPYVSDLDDHARPAGRQPDITIHKASIDGGVSLGVPGPGSYSSLHKHRDSVSTSASDSAGSSPTTTASLLDSNSVGETPGQSPDTPASTQSLGYGALAAALHSTKPQDLLSANLAELNRPAAPAKKARNLKNLAVNTQGTLGVGRGISTAALPLQTPAAMSTFAAPSTPGFVKPHTPQRKSSSRLGLTITTDAVSLPLRRDPDVVPQTPSLVRPASLRHFQSSPSLNLLTSKVGPVGGMRLPPIATRNTVAVGFADVPFEYEEDEEQNFDIPLSREEKPDSYPDGPICIYDPHVYLYYEPSAAQALTYDVIFNVASEVRNPLPGPAKDLNAAEADSGPARSSSSPATPRASEANVATAPEYVHIPWEHNTDIVPDLYRLVKIVDERVQQGKKVLIHCQCGVSRSASLIVAYGLYKNPSITVQEAYDAVKRRSKWIGPNMSLIMQLQEFRSGLLRSSAGVTKIASKTHLTRPTFNRSQSAQGEQFVRSHTRMPMSAPLPPDVKNLAPEAASAVGDHDKALDAGPSSAPSGIQWPSEPDSPSNAHPSLEIPNNIPAPKLQQASADTASNHATRIDPPRLQMQLPPESATDNLFSPRSTEFAMNPVFPSTTSNADDAFGLTSPRGHAPGGLPPATSLQNINSSSLKDSPTQTLALDELTSPRASSFGPAVMTLPHRLVTATRGPEVSAIPKAKPILPKVDTAKDSLARAEVGARMGMTRRSNYDLRAAFLSGTSRADDLAELPPLPSRESSRARKLKAAPSLPDFAEALMSPRATEFTNNPFREPAKNEASGGAFPWPPIRRVIEPEDPRSPAQKGANPIVRNIFDFL